MTPFNSSTRISRAIKDPGTDCKLPSVQSLSWKSIATSTALKTTKGVYSELLHGNRCQQTNGNHTEIITGNQRHTVEGNQTISVGGNHKETIVEHCSQSIIGPHLVTNHTVRNETRMGSCSTIYGLLTIYDHVHDGRFFYADTYYRSADVMSFELDSVGKAELHGVHVEFAPVHVEVKAFKAEADLLDFSGAIFEEATPVTSSEMTAVKSRVHGMTNTISLDHLKLGAVKQDFHLVEQKVGALSVGQKLSMHSLPQTGPFV